MEEKEEDTCVMQWTRRRDFSCEQMDSGYDAVVAAAVVREIVNDSTLP